MQTAWQFLRKRTARMSGMTVRCHSSQVVLQDLKSRQEVKVEGIMMPSTAAVLDYAGQCGGRRYEAWLEGVCRNFGRVDAEALVDDRIDWKIGITQISSLAFADVSGTSGRFLRTHGLLADACDDFVLITAVSDEVNVTQGSRTVRLRQSQMCLMTMSIEGAVALNDGHRFTATRIPRAALLGMCPTAETRLYQPIGENHHIRQLIAQYSALSTSAVVSLDVVAQQAVAGHVVDLIALLLRTGPDETQLAIARGYASARLRSVQQHVLDQLSDNGLTVGAAAQACGLSPKQVQRLFERTGTTFTEFVLEQRLLLARRKLASPANRREKIGAIAYTAGFGDLSYFNRAFRARFGMTPSEWRNGRPDQQ